MKDSTKRNLAAIGSVVMSVYFTINGLVQFGSGNIGHGLFGLAFGIGMAATLIAIFKKPIDGKLYNIAIILGGLPSFAFAGIAIWSIFDGSFKPASLFQLVVGVVGLLTVNIVISKGEEVEKSIEENTVDANE
jgi:hypothetical protein